MTNKSKLAEAIERSLIWALLSVTALAVTPAMGQTSNVSDEDEVIEEVITTGSRIRRTEVSETTPIFSFDEDEIAVRGFTNVADILTQSPLFGGNQTPLGGQNGFTAGQNNVNIFDLGTQRTLTLINGRRMVSGTSASLGGSQVDLNTIPASLVQDIQVVPLTGAATYGADAIAGTVNIILKEDYEGFEITAQYGDNFDGNADSLQISTLAGGNFSNGRGNIVFGAEYTRDEGLLDCEQQFLCEGSYDATSSQSSYVDLDGDGVIDDRNGDGVIDSDDRTTLHLAAQDAQLQLFTEFGAVSLPGSGFLPDRGLGSLPDGNFYEFTRNGNLTPCTPGTPTARSLVTSGRDTCSIDFFDSVNQIRSPVSRFNTYFGLNYDLTENVRFKQNVLFANTKGRELVNQGGFQTGFFGGTSAAIRLSTTNPFLSDQARQTLVDAGLPGDEFFVHRFNNDIVSLGANSNETQTWRAVNILEGEFDFADREWFWDASVVVGRADVELRQTGIVDGRFLNAVDARRVDDTLLEQIRLQDPDDPTDDLADADAALAALQGARSQFTGTFQRGDIICGAWADLAAGTLTGFNSRASGSGLTDEDLPFIDGCVPLNLFGSQASRESREFVTGGQQISSASNDQLVYNLNIGSTIVDLPGGPLDFVAGYEMRVEDTKYDPAVGQRVPITRSSILQPISGGFDTSEWYLEVNAPLISGDMDIPLVQSLELNAAYRDQEFNTDAPFGLDDRSTDESVWTASLRWTVIDSLSIRSTFATAFRNPSIEELFRPESQSFISGDDPCDFRSVALGPNPDVRRANCESIGIDTATFVSSIQDGTISGGLNSGNPALQAETSEAYSFGFIWQPEFVENLDISIDYYNLEIDDQISDVEFEDFAAACFDSPNFPNVSQCDTFVRDPATNQVISARNAPDNVAFSTFEAVSISLFYDFEVADALSLFGGDNTRNLGNLAIRSQTQHNITNEFQATADSETTEDVGDFADPDWIGTLDFDYTYNDFRANLRARWQSSVKVDALDQILYGTSDSVETITGELTDGTPIGTVYTAANLSNETDARWIWDLSLGYEVTENTTVQMNVLNLLERKPDEAGNVADAFGHFGVDEELGRRVSLRVNHRF